MKRLLAMTVATVIATSGCRYLDAWQYGDYGYGCYDACGDGAVYGDGAYYGEGAYDGEVYLPGDGAIVGPEIIVPGETIPAPAGEPLPGPAQ